MRFQNSDIYRFTLVTRLSVDENVKKKIIDENCSTKMPSRCGTTRRYNSENNDSEVETKLKSRRDDNAARCIYVRTVSIVLQFKSYIILKRAQKQKNEILYIYSVSKYRLVYLY